MLRDGAQGVTNTTYPPPKPLKGEDHYMTEAEVLQAAKMAKGRWISFEITQKGELLDEKIVWPGDFSIWLQNPRTLLVHRMDDFHQAEAVMDLEIH
jgi:hypothetical protein